MNIFIIHENMIESAKQLPDKLLIKQILEIAQILCTVEYYNGYLPLYKPSHQNHPVIKWADKNRDITYTYGLILCREYTYRFNKVHKSEEVIKSFLLGRLCFPKTKFVDFPIPNDLNYLKEKIKKWKRIPRWTNREFPEWL